MAAITPVVICGGSGSRLWPASRASYPKQFIALFDDQSLLQMTVQRLQALCDHPPMLVANAAHRFIIRRQLRELGVQNASILLEPEGRNTAPAIALAAMEAMRHGDDVLLVMPADHFIGDIDALRGAIGSGLVLAEQGMLVTFGVKPTRAETGYGYIQAGAPLERGNRVARFVEKPKRDVAETYVASGEYLWNSGIFMFRPSRYLEELGKFRPDILDAIRHAHDGGEWEQEAFLSERNAFCGCPDDSVDYAVMERTEDAAVVALDAAWTDVGNWHALWEVKQKDTNGNSMQGPISLLDTNNCYVQAEHRLVAMVGVDNLVVVETRDAVLVTTQQNAQRVKDLLQQVKDTGSSQATEHRLMHRPWGTYDALDSGDRFQVKRIVVNPGAQLSLQMHHHRAEHWIVVAGTAEVTCDDRTFLLGENQSTYIPLGSTHRLANPGRLPLEVIEVQSGAYLGEDDIVRIKDHYGRTR